MNKISVIVPAYNSSEFIQKTIDSLLAQTYQNCEFIFVDDGSKDNTAEIITKNSFKDSRIKLISTQNRGVSAARNAGLSIAEGEFILFLDSDDLLIHDSLELLLNLAEKEGADVVFGTHVSFTNKNIPILKTNKKSYVKFKLLNKIEMHKMLAKCTKLDNFIWGKLFNRRLFKEYRFNNDCRVWEDVKEMYKIIEMCSKGVFVNKDLVLYRISSDSLSKKLTDEKLNEFCVAQMCKANFYLNNYPRIAKLHSESMFQCASEIVSRDKENEIKSFDEFIKLYRKIIKKSRLIDKLKFYLVTHKKLFRMVFANGNSN